MLQVNQLVGFGKQAFTSSFPIVQSRSFGNRSTSGTSHLISNMPSGVQPGDLLLVVFSLGAAGTVSISAGTGWSIFDQDIVGSATQAIVTKAASGSDSLTLGTSVSNTSSYVVLRISGAGTMTGASVGVINTSTPNPPNHAPAGGSKKYLWIATTSCDSLRTVTGAPSNGFTNLTTQGSVDAVSATAERQLEAASLDPNAFTVSGISDWLSRTIAIAPA